MLEIFETPEKNDQLYPKGKDSLTAAGPDADPLCNSVLILLARDCEENGASLG
jgi:hypothetical protein